MATEACNGVAEPSAFTTLAAACVDFFAGNISTLTSFLGRHIIPLSPNIFQIWLLADCRFDLLIRRLLRSPRRRLRSPRQRGLLQSGLLDELVLGPPLGLAVLPHQGRRGRVGDVIRHFERPEFSMAVRGDAQTPLQALSAPYPPPYLTPI